MHSKASTMSCGKCVHYFMTYDTRFPYGCRAMNFKSRRVPEMEVIEATYARCVMFKPNPRKVKNEV